MKVGIFKRKQENKNSTMKAIKKTRNQERKQELDQEKKRKNFLCFLITFFVEFLFSYFLVFFYKFPPQDDRVELGRPGAAGPGSRCSQPCECFRTSQTKVFDTPCIRQLQMGFYVFFLLLFSIHYRH